MTIVSMKKEDFGPVVPPEVIKNMDLEEAPHMGPTLHHGWKELWSEKYMDYLITGQCSVSNDEVMKAYQEATILNECIFSCDK